MVPRSSSFTEYVFFVFFFIFLYFFKVLFAAIVLFLFAENFLISFIVSVFCFCFCFLWTSVIFLTSSSPSRLIKSSSFSCWYVLSSINEEVLFSGARLIKSSSFSYWYVLLSIKEVLFFCFLAFASLIFLYFSLIFLVASCAFFPGSKVASSSKSLMVSFDSRFFGVSFL